MVSFDSLILQLIYDVGVLRLVLLFGWVYGCWKLAMHLLKWSGKSLKVCINKETGEIWE